MSKLSEILAHKAGEIERAKAAISLGELKRMAGDAPPVRGFRYALAHSGKPLALIAEVKKASPSKGLIRENFDPVQIAEAYRDAGADCLSVLTDAKYFQGSKANLELARAASGLPCLRKDFMIDPYQIYEARCWGADCILLIVAAFPGEFDLMRGLYGLAKELGMDVLVEVHSESEVEPALGLGADLIGVNNRDLSDMRTSLTISEELLPLIAPHALAVSESALETPGDLERVRVAGAGAVLIGTTFCASPDVGGKVREVMGW